MCDHAHGGDVRQGHAADNFHHARLRRYHALLQRRQVLQLLLVALALGRVRVPRARGLRPHPPHARHLAVQLREVADPRAANSDLTNPCKVKNNRLV